MKKKAPVLVTKSTGEKVPFDVIRLRKSLERSRADETAINAVISTISEILYDGISTKEIYSKAFQLLKKKSRSSAARYKLKNAIMELGPAGFAFEKFIAALLNAEGYKTRTGQILEGKCVQHEVDVLAERGNVRCVIECKFHSNRGNFSNVKVPLYINSRFNDLVNAWSEADHAVQTNFEGWVVTNTRFTLDAEQYGKCAGLQLLSWDKPKGNSIRERIDRSGLHPVTSVTSLSRAEKQALLDMDVVLCSDLINAPRLLNKIGVSKRRSDRILGEVHQLCALG